MPKPFVPPTIQLPDMINSVTSEGSISNFVAQTPKNNQLVIDFKKSPHQLNNYYEQKQNISYAANSNLNQNNSKFNQLPYKMVSSELPAACANHSDRQSSFFIESDEALIFYCEKCAILVASQGFVVKKIESNCDQMCLRKERSSNACRFSLRETKTIKKSKMIEMITKQQKQSQLTNFLNNLQRVQGRMDKIYESKQSKLIEMDSHVQSQGKKIKQLFTGLHKVLDQFEEYYLEQLQSKSMNVRQPLQTAVQELSNDSTTLQSMKEDICQAYDDIISHTTSSEFQTVMKAYNENIRQIENVLEDYEDDNEDVMGVMRGQLAVEIQGEDVINGLRKQIQANTQSSRRPSVKSTRRRVSIAQSKIR